MGRLVTFEEIDQSYPRSMSITTSSAELSSSRLGKVRRKSITVVALTAGVTVTITKGENPAVANAGIILTQNQAYFESDDQKSPCWQGAIQVVGSAAGTIAIQEVFESVAGSDQEVD